MAKEKQISPWRVSKKGYEIKDGMIQEKGVGDDCATVDLCRLDKEMYIRFSKLSNPEEICEFAGKYGLLGSKNKKQTDEKLEIWEKEIDKMGIILGLWRFCQTNDLKRLEELWADFFKSVPEDPVVFKKKLIHHFLIMIHKLLRPELVNFPKPEVFLREEPDGRCKLVFDLIPATLHQALWLQVATRINEGRPSRPCNQCGMWFTIPPKGPITKVEFCSVACKLRAFRDRQDRARQLAADGKSFEEIATEIGSDVKVITRWITGRKE